MSTKLNNKRKASPPQHISEQERQWFEQERATLMPSLTKEDRDHLDSCYLKATATMLTDGVVRKIATLTNTMADECIEEVINAACQQYIKQLQNTRRQFPTHKIAALMKFLTRDVDVLKFMEWSINTNSNGYVLLTSPVWVENLVAELKRGLMPNALPVGLHPTPLELDPVPAPHDETAPIVESPIVVTIGEPDDGKENVPHLERQDARAYYESFEF